MKKALLITSLCVMFLAACTNDREDIKPPLPMRVWTVLTAGIDQEVQSRTNFIKEDSKGKSFWTNGDKIQVGSTDGSFYEFDLTGGAGDANATFEGNMIGILSTCAVYPSSIAKSIEDNFLTIEMPNAYNYSYEQSDYATSMDATLNSINIPMVAKIENGSTDLKFQNLAGVFCFKFKEVPAGTSKIVFTTHSKISGRFTVDISEEYPSISTTTLEQSRDIDLNDMSVAVTFNPSEKVTTRVVYFPAPCGTYNGYRVVMYNNSDEPTNYLSSYNSKIITRSGCIVYREISVPSIIAEPVDLGLSVKWATCNIGASKPEYFGDYFEWGETITKSSYRDSNSIWFGLSYPYLEDAGVIGSNGNLNIKYDAARAIWGGKWRMPTKDEIDELLNNCTWESSTQSEIAGYLVTSKKNGSSLFFPAAGYRDFGYLREANGTGYYRSSTAKLEEDNYTYELGFKCNNGYACQNHSHKLGFSIRPVTE